MYLLQVWLFTALLKLCLSMGNYGRAPDDRLKEVVTHSPQPYEFNYNVMDENGNVHFRREKGDSSGVVSGSYGYTNQNGLYRNVEYVADRNGFKAQVKSNEPGVGLSGHAPADVTISGEAPPSGVQNMPHMKGTPYIGGAQGRTG